MAYEDGVIATFYDEAVKDERESKERGYPVFNDVLYIKIQVPNQIDCVPRPARDADKQRFPKSWEAYQTGKEPVDSGFPVDQWPQLTASEVKILQSIQVKTVEQLAELPDSGIHRLGPGGHDMKKRAKRFLDSASEGAALRQRIQELERKIEELTAAKPAKRQPKKLKVSSG